MELPLFPLNTVLLPGGVLPLRIFEARYIDMIGECMRNDTGFGVCLIHSGKETGDGAEIYPFGTFCRIVDWQQLPDGLLGITAQAEYKIKVIRHNKQANNLLVGSIEVIDEPAEAALPEEFTSLASLLQQIIGEIGPPYSNLHTFFDQAGWVGARLVELLPLDLPVKQKLLEIDDHLVRLFHLRDAMMNMKYI